MHYYAHSPNNLISPQAAWRWILSSLETVQCLMHVTHVKVTQTKEAVECAGNFFFSLTWCSETSCLTEIIMWRRHTRFASPACSKHQMFFLTFWAELLRHSEQVSVPPRAKGQIRRKKLHHNQPLQTFHPTPKPSHYQLQACTARSLFLILILFHFQMVWHVHWGFSGEMSLSMYNFNSLASCNYFFSYSKIWKMIWVCQTFSKLRSFSCRLH